MSRRPYVGGNWKMNTNRASGAALAESVIDGCAGLDNVDVSIFPPFPYLLRIGGSLEERGSSIRLGAQDVYHADDGAYTGEVSPGMLRDCQVKVVLTGHSERRHVIGESDEIVNQKTLAVLNAGLDCILCVGETLDQRESGQTDVVNERQVRAGLKDVSRESMARLTIAYEPVWAIGTGRTATPEDAQTAQQRIRAVVADLHGSAIADGVRIQYGGSVKPANAASLFGQPDVDGGLIGGASLSADDFVAIVQAASRASAP